MKKRHALLITLTVLGLSFTGCQTTTNNTVTQQEEVTQTSNQNQMEAQTPKSNIASEKSTQKESSDSSVAETTAPADSTDGTSKAVLTEEEAKQIAFTDANIKEADIDHIRINRDRDDGREIYEIEFYVENKEYDYDIDVTTGEILGKDSEIEDDFYRQKTEKATTAGTEISRKEAIQIVLDRVEGASSQDVRLELDYDDGYKVYEGELYHNQIEYEFELNAETGEILKWSEDREDD